jgi:methionyl-tRNA synthetase
VEVPYFLSKYDPDALRFYLTAVAPETRDTEFSWEDFVERNNNELVATWGNLANRMLSFAYKRFDGRVPEPGPLDDEDQALLEKVEAGFETVGELYNVCKFRAALGECLALAREANGYLDRKAPWFQIKEDPQAAATSVYVILRVVDNLKTIPAPIPQPRGVDLRPHGGSGCLGGEPTATRPGAAPAGAAVQEAG